MTEKHLSIGISIVLYDDGKISIQSTNKDKVFVIGVLEMAKHVVQTTSLMDAPSTLVPRPKILVG